MVVSDVGITRPMCVVQRPYTSGLGAVGEKSDVDRIVDVVSTPESSGPVRRNFKQVLQRWDRPVVEIRSPNPHSIKWDRYITLARPETARFPSAPPGKCVVGFRGVGRPRAQPMAICVNDA